MSRLLPLKDFRARRRVLTADDFALGGDDIPPKDLIDEYTWNGLTTLPTDVSIRTSSHNGDRLKTLYALWGQWLHAIALPDDDGPPKDDMTFSPMLDASDEFQAAIFSALHGFYRPAIGCLRNSLELVAIGSACQTRKLDTRYKNWSEGREEFGFGAACDQLLGASSLNDLRRHLANIMHDSLFDRRAQNNDGGWIRRLFAELSDSAHSRPGSTSGDLWSSNGPVYVTEAFNLYFDKHIETLAACFIMVKIAKPDLQVGAEVLQFLFERPRSPWLNVAVESAKYLGLISAK